MLFEYFAEADMLYIELVQGKSTESEEIAPGVVLDYNDQHQIVGIEIEDASKIIDLTKLELRSFPLVNLLLQPTSMAVK